MEKKAQKRSVLNQIREKMNMPGAYLEGFFKPELDRVMNALKELDDRVRSQLTGTKIGNAEAPEITTSAKDLLKSARSNFNRREYMTGVADLGMFHKKMFDITQDISKFFVDVNKIHHKFLFEGMDDEKLKRLREHMERKASVQSEYFIKEAGIMDFFVNLTSKRGRSLMAWEKKYPKQTKELREQGAALVDYADNLLASTLTHLKEMATARAVRRPDDYIEAANKIKAEFDKFDSGSKGFKAYYNNVISPFLKLKDSMDAELAAQQAAEQQAQQQNQEPSAPVSDVAPPSTAVPFPLVNPPAAPDTIPAVQEAPPTLRDPNAPPKSDGTTLKSADSKFLQILESMGNEDPIVLSKFISKYAASIQKTNPSKAIKLLQLVKQIKG